jgi:hypothetical protein
MQREEMTKVLELCRVGFSCLTFLVLAAGLLHGQKQQQKYADWRSSQFRYIIHANDANLDNPAKPIRRVVHVLLDRDAFGLENLKKLFALVSKRFPQPDWLEVWVRTSLIQIPTPEEKDEPQISESPFLDPHEGEHPTAVMIRIQDNELIRYTPARPYIGMKTIILKGTDPPTLKDNSR